MKAETGRTCDSKGDSYVDVVRLVVGIIMAEMVVIDMIIM